MSGIRQEGFSTLIGLESIGTLWLRRITGERVAVAFTQKLA
jgi:hypothetical protein